MHTTRWNAAHARAICFVMHEPSRTLPAALAGVLAVLLCATAASAARITVERGETPTVIVRGTLESNDGQRFGDAIKGVQKAIVLLTSNGGDLDSGLAIGRAIRQNKFTTGVPDGAQCASACALAWLGGTTRYMARGARIGFHAAYVEGKGGPRESGVGNALVGAYLNSLGLAEKAVIYMTSPPPNDIQWLTMDDARTIGIEVAVLTARLAPTTRPDDPPPDRRPSARPPSGTPPSGTPPSGKPPLITENEQGTKPTWPGVGRPPPATRPAMRQQALEFIGGYFDHWSDLDSRAMEFIEELYADTVDFYGKQTDRRAIIDMKQKFVERWPIRVYTIRPESIRVACGPNGSDCTIEGLVDWECLNPRRGTRSFGLSDFTIGATFTSAGSVTVYREAGKVLSKSPEQ